MISWPRNVPPPSETIFRAANGDSDAVQFVLRQFSPLIHRLSMSVPTWLREDVEDEIRVLLLESLRNFRKRRFGGHGAGSAVRVGTRSYHSRRECASVGSRSRSATWRAALPSRRRAARSEGSQPRPTGNTLSVVSTRPKAPGCVEKMTSTRPPGQGTALPSPSASSRGASPQSRSRS